MAIGHITDEVERARIEVELRVALGAAFIATRGFGAPDVLDAYSRAETLCDRLGERADLFPAIWGQWMFRTGRGETTAGRRLGARLLALAKKFDNTGLRYPSPPRDVVDLFRMRGACAGARARGRCLGAVRAEDPSAHGLELRQS